MIAAGFSLAELASLDNNERVLWLAAVRAHQARIRLERQDDVNAGFFPDRYKLLKLYLAELAYADDPVAYEQAVYAISSIRSTVTES